jgi:hypothetical protein
MSSSGCATPRDLRRRGWGTRSVSRVFVSHPARARLGPEADEARRESERLSLPAAVALAHSLTAR